MHGKIEALFIICFASLIVINIICWRYNKKRREINYTILYDTIKNGRLDSVNGISSKLDSGTKKILNVFFDKYDSERHLIESNKQAQYLALQNQINPHFLYNTLDSISSDALYGGMDEIANTARALSAFFRYTISDVGTVATLKDELENADNYYIVQKYRFGNRLNLVVDIDKIINLDQLKMPRLTLQPILENAIIHGIEAYGGNRYIRIELEMLEDGYYVYVIDNGRGMDSEALNKLNEELQFPMKGDASNREKRKGGIGMRNVALRIKLLFGENYGIRVYSTVGSGTKVAIWLPVDYENI